MKHPFAALASALLSSAMVFACAPAPQLPEGEQVLSEHEITVLVAGNAFTTDGKPDPKKMVEPPQIWRGMLRLYCVKSFGDQPLELRAEISARTIERALQGKRSVQEIRNAPGARWWNFAVNTASRETIETHGCKGRSIDWSRTAKAGHASN